ncbi:MAG: ribosome-associated translation inhibitor RaiA [SAR202 cluster bacterium]|nr:ribosome-associated translation inhibitor RaiA [SAR202 cluster bacterium]
MELKIKTRNIELTPQTQDYIQKKFERLDRHLKPEGSAQLEVSRTMTRAEADRIEVQLSFVVKGYMMRAQARSSNVNAAMDAVTDLMDRQIERFKGKVYRSEQGKRSTRNGDVSSIRTAPGAEPVSTNGAESHEEPRVVRTKRFAMRPMSVEDAILEMELVNHAFYLFNNVDTKKYSVVYRRTDGGYGLIEPETA